MLRLHVPVNIFFSRRRSRWWWQQGQGAPIILKWHVAPIMVHQWPCQCQALPPPSPPPPPPYWKPSYAGALDKDVELQKERIIYEPRHDKTNKMSVRPAKTQISLGVLPVWSESSLCTQWVAKAQCFFKRTAKTLIRLGACSGWSESSLGAHSLCWFCNVAAHTMFVCGVRSNKEYQKNANHENVLGAATKLYMFVLVYVTLTYIPWSSSRLARLYCRI